MGPSLLTVRRHPVPARSAPLVGGAGGTPPSTGDSLRPPQVEIGPRERMLREWLPVVGRTGIAPEVVLRAADRASANGTGFVVELLASGEIDEAILFQAIADELDLPFLSGIEAKTLKVPERYRLMALRRPRGVPLALLERADGTTLHIIATPDVGISVMRARLEASPGLKTRLAVSPPSVLRTAILEL